MSSSANVHNGPRHVWILSKQQDLYAFGLAPGLAIATAYVGRAAGLRELPLWGFLLFVVAIDVAHVHATLFRVYFDPLELRRRWLLYGATPMVAYAFGVGLYQVSALTFWRVLAYLAVWHFVRQQFGWLAIYRARNTRRDLTTGGHQVWDDWLTRLTLAGGMIAPLVHWHAHLPQSFSWFIRGDFSTAVQGIAQGLNGTARWCSVALLALFFLRQVQLGLSRVHWGIFVLVTGTWLTWWTGIVWFGDDFSFTVTNVVPHGVPYFFLVWRYTSRRYREPEMTPGIGKKLASRGWPFAFGLLILLAFVEEFVWERWVWHDHEGLFGSGPILTPELLGWLVPLLAVPQATHYILDGFVWRRSNNPGLSARLFG